MPIVAADFTLELLPMKQILVMPHNETTPIVKVVPINVENSTSRINDSSLPPFIATQFVDEKMGSLSVTISNYDSQHIDDMFVSVEGTTLLLQMSSGKSFPIILEVAVEADTLRAKYRKKTCDCIVNARIKR